MVQVATGIGMARSSNDPIQDTRPTARPVNLPGQRSAERAGTVGVGFACAHGSVD
jgi:hypothetical protein